MKRSWKVSSIAAACVLALSVSFFSVQSVDSATPTETPSEYPVRVGGTYVVVIDMSQGEQFLSVKEMRGSWAQAQEAGKTYWLNMDHVIIVRIPTAQERQALKEKVRPACDRNLVIIQGAKKQWALQEKAGPDVEPKESDLVGPDGFMVRMPVCPSGGEYSIGEISEEPMCSVHTRLF